MSTQINQNWLRPELIGPAIILALNLVGLFWLDQPAARFLSDDWWSVWFPAYLAASFLIIIGAGSRRYFGAKDR